MRTVLLAVLMSFAIDAAAQAARARPEGTIPLDVPPPVSEAAAEEAELERQVTTRTEAGQTIEEHRVGGKVVMQRITPRHGRSYVLMDPKADGSITKLDNSIDGHLSVPQWVLLEF